MKRRSIAMVKKITELALSLVMILAVFAAVPFSASAAEAGATVIIHYQRPDGDYDDWNIWVWNGGLNGQFDFTAEDDFGKVGIIETTAKADELGFIIRKGEWAEKDVADDRFIPLVDGVNEIWCVSGEAEFLTEAPEGCAAFDLEAYAAALEAAKEQAAADAAAALAENEGQPFIVHYHRYAADYDVWDLWVWSKSYNSGEGYAFTGEDDFGKVAMISVPNTEPEDEIGFIVRVSDWSAKDVSEDRFVPVANYETKEIWLVQGDPNIYMSVDEVDLAAKFLSATIENVDMIKIKTTVPFDADASKFSITGSDGSKLGVSAVKADDAATSATLTPDGELSLSVSYTLSLEGFEDAALTLDNVFDAEAFAELYTYDGDDLGAVYSRESTAFRVWAPTATAVELCLYESGNGGEAFAVAAMMADVNGTWICAREGDLNGVYYTYKVHFGDKVNEAVDPYARSTGANGSRGMIIDLDATDPEGWDDVERPAFKNFTDAVICELHIKDITNKDSTNPYAGTYMGLTVHGTTNSSGAATGLDHLMELGVTHVQIQPMYDYHTVDELGDKDQFNWGYDPQNYNVPEGSYSSDATDGAVRVGEVKQMVKALHESGIRVNMDVVYNHTYDVTSNLNLIVPGYYYRMDAEGGYCNGSGCGNETASNRSMCRKYIVDSVVYWASEYKIDGYRFDLMGVHDLESMQAVRDALDKLDPTIMVYGEGWTGGTSGWPTEDSAVKANIWQLRGVGAFSDDIRDGIKGSVFDSSDLGFVSGDTSRIDYIKAGVVACTDNEQVDYTTLGSYSKASWAAEPGQCLIYAECHDNMTLWDKLNSARADASVEQLVKMDKLAASIVFTCQGVPFIQLGQDFLRTKFDPETGSYDSNSYKSSNEVNNINWERKSEYIDVYDYYKGLIAFRAAHPSLRLTTAAEIGESLKFIDLGETALAYTIDETSGESFNRLMVVHNAGTEPITVELPDGGWDVYIDGEKAGTTVINTVSGSVEVSPVSSLVMVQCTDRLRAFMLAPCLFGMTGGVCAAILLALLVVILVVILIIRRSRKAKRSLIDEPTAAPAEEKADEQADAPAEESAEEKAEAPAEESAEEKADEQAAE